jgi:hypothetical protein
MRTRPDGRGLSRSDLVWPRHHRRRRRNRRIPHPRWDPSRQAGPARRLHQHRNLRTQAAENLRNRFNPHTIVIPKRVAQRNLPFPWSEETQARKPRQETPTPLSFRSAQRRGICLSRGVRGHRRGSPGSKRQTFPASPDPNLARTSAIGRSFQNRPKFSTVESVRPCIRST